MDFRNFALKMRAIGLIILFNKIQLVWRSWADLRLLLSRIRLKFMDCLFLFQFYFWFLWYFIWLHLLMEPCLVLHKMKLKILFQRNSKTWCNQMEMILENCKVILLIHLKKYNLDLNLCQIWISIPFYLKEWA